MNHRIFPFKRTLTRTLTLTFALALSLNSHAQLTPQQLIAKSVAYHDPAGTWWKKGHFLSLKTTPSKMWAEKTKGYAQLYDIDIHPDTAYFSMSFYNKQEDKHTQLWKKGNDCKFLKDARPIEMEALKTGIGMMTCAQMGFWRDYMRFLFSLPMNLKDSGLEFITKVTETQFAGAKVLTFQAKYSGGKEVWDYYFNPSTYALVGVAFSKDGKHQNGEYIVFEGETSGEGYRLPRARKWYYHKDDAHLATDVLLSIPRQH